MRNDSKSHTKMDKKLSRPPVKCRIVNRIHWNSYIVETLVRPSCHETVSRVDHTPSTWSLTLTFILRPFQKFKVEMGLVNFYRKASYLRYEQSLATNEEINLPFSIWDQYCGLLCAKGKNSHLLSKFPTLTCRKVHVEPRNTLVCIVDLICILCSLSRKNIWIK